MRVVSLASSSKGNAYWVNQGGVSLVIDCGVPYKTFANLSFDAVLITHTHDDHVSGLKTLLRHRDLPVYANAMTAETLIARAGIDESAFVCFENGQSFDIGPFSILPFSIPHDTSDPVGYLIRTEGGTYFHGTDIGTPLESIGQKLAEADVATLESNHDAVLLKRCNRPSSLIQRIAGPRGHLSNDQACELVRCFASPRLKDLRLAHLSRDCNTPFLAREAMAETLRKMNRTDITLTILDP